VDESEKRVLRNILGKVDSSDVKPHVWQRIVEIRRKYGI
jgi:hypothetical protein